MPARRSDETANSSQSSNNGTQSERFKEEQVKDKARALIRFFLAASAKKQVIKRQEIIEKVLKDTPRAFNIVLERANSIMDRTFGLSVVELEKPNKTFCVVNKLELDGSSPHLKWCSADNQNAALLMICLSIIFMSGGTVQDEVLYNALKRVGLDIKKPSNPPFGDLKHLITVEFVQQGYLVCKKIPETDPPKSDFEWGHRAEAITTKDDVLSFVCQIYDDMEMYDWPQHYDSIHGVGAAAKAKAEAQSSTTE